MNKMNSTNNSNSRITDPCNIQYEDIISNKQRCERIIGPYPYCYNEITTTDGKQYHRHDSITHYIMSDMSPKGKITHCPYEWWQKWTSPNNQ